MARRERGAGARQVDHPGRCRACRYDDAPAGHQPTQLVRDREPRALIGPGLFVPDTPTSHDHREIEIAVEDRENMAVDCRKLPVAAANLGHSGAEVAGETAGGRRSPATSGHAFRVRRKLFSYVSECEGGRRFRKMTRL